MTTPRAVLQAGPERVVVLEEDGETVRKEFVGTDPAEQLRLAYEEHDRLAMLWEAVARVDGVTCPRPLGVDAGPPVALRMTRAAGKPLLEHLRRAPGPPPAVVACALADGLEAYVAAMDEPYDDFHLRNVLLAPDGRVTLIDVGSAPTDVADGDPFVTSVGNLVAGIVFEAGRPHGVLRRRQRSQSVRVAGALVAELRRRGHDLPADRVAAVVCGRLRDVTCGPTRRLWFATAGRASARPRRILLRTLG